MRSEAIIAGVGMTTFGKHLDLGLKAIGGEAVTAEGANCMIETVVGPVLLPSTRWTGDG